jgi:adenosylmethionine-8-amino-7-oxononanoate aminotransferase
MLLAKTFSKETTANVDQFIILGTDTDAGKTTFALLWLACFGDAWNYWKPLETGDSDSERVTQLIPAVCVHPPLLRLRTPVAPLLAGRLEGETIPTARQIADCLPLNGNRGLVIETFGGPFSPLNDDELQIAILHELKLPCVLVSSAKLGSIGRTLQAMTALRAEGIAVHAIVLLGERDPFAEEQVRRHVADIPTLALEPPTDWTMAGVQACAERQRTVIASLSQRERGEMPQSSILHEDRRCVWHPYTPLLGVDDPLVCIGAQDEYLHLANGESVIDAIASWWTILHGHRHPPLMRALRDASHTLDHVLFAGVTHPHAVELADLLLGTMPWCGGRVFYSDNGSTAVEVALKMAYQYWRHHDQPQRTRFVGFEHGYHGDTFGAMAVSRDPVFFGSFEPLLFQADILPLDPQRLDEHLQKHAHETAAIILEPLVQGAGGMRMHTPETLHAIVEIARNHHVLFIADEVMTGGGRTGTLWAHQAAGVTPDFVCAAKTLTGGVLPLAATLIAPRIVEAFLTADRQRTFFHGHSFTANPLACAVAACNMRALVPGPLDAPRRIEAFWIEALQELREHPTVKEVRIKGSIAAIEVNVPGGYLADVGQRMRRIALAHGVFLRPLGNVLYAMPPYCTTTESLHRIANAMIAAVREM